MQGLQEPSRNTADSAILRWEPVDQRKLQYLLSEDLVPNVWEGVCVCVSDGKTNAQAAPSWVNSNPHRGCTKSTREKGYFTAVPQKEVTGKGCS